LPGDLPDCAQSDGHERRGPVGGIGRLAIPIRDQEPSRRFYEAYFGFGARPARRDADGVLMLYDDAGFALALGQPREPIVRPSLDAFASA
jgi:hypothetical protein